MRAQSWHRMRPWIQIVSFLLFLLLFMTAGRVPWPPTDLYFLLDPLVGIAGMLASRHLLPTLLLGTFIALAVTLALGRVWCGWICPLGTTLDWTPGRQPRLDQCDPSPHWRQAKYFLLGLILIMALMGSLTLLILDPITLLYRALATALWPGLVHLITGAESALYQVPLLGVLIDAFEAAARGPILPLYQPLYRGNVLVLSLLGLILALNAIRKRFWCRYLCPLGALLGLASKVAWLRRVVEEGCIDCHLCARACPMGTIDPARGHESDPSECTMCLDCVPVCLSSEQHFVGHWRPAAWRSYDPSRRQVLASAGAALALVGLFGAEPATGREHPYLIRPPGARENDFLAKCIRCGICMRVCPTSGLQPSLGEAGWAGLWTPVLIPRLGYCDYACNACGQACPVGAIPPLSLEEKRQAVIGHAYIDRDRCIPWADLRDCIVCEEMCPIPDKAVVLEETEIRAPDGVVVRVRLPHVVRDQCIGCGICEYYCPLNGEAAIRVYAPT
ncbi:MAG TPA: 4Fe-4S binding protein, partial [Caldilineae bacterium]|nr:4Fe-4S binding protein [Caldilineae bacterium]